jgi:hypothetical protein
MINCILFFRLPMGAFIFSIIISWIIKFFYKKNLLKKYIKDVFLFYYLTLELFL